MITLFTTTKPFHGANKIHQLNSLRSWKTLHPAIEIFVFGNEEGAADVCSDLNIRHIPNVECSSQGTPLITAMFAMAAQLGRYPVQCYVNCDIVFIGDLEAAINKVPLDRYLIVGQRFNLNVPAELNFSVGDWGDGLLMVRGAVRLAQIILFIPRESGKTFQC